MYSVSIKLSAPQAKKLMKGKTVQLKKGFLEDGTVPICVSESHAKKMQQAHDKSKGYRLTLTQDEIDSCMQNGGEGLKEILESVKKVGRVVKKGTQAASKAIGKEKFRGMLTEGLQRGIKAVLPQAAPIANMYADDLVNYIGDKTGAYGVNPSPVELPAVGSSVGVKRKSKYKLGNSFSQLMGAEHPAMQPIASKMSRPGLGGSFRSLI